MAYEAITTELSDSVLTITLNRPEALNAYTARMGAELADAFVRADADDAVRVIIVTGAGRGFCAGADMSAGADAFGGDGAKLFGEGRPTTGAPKGGFVEAIYACRKPSIAAINGGAVGVGITMTLPMDIRIAAEGAKIGFVFARRGIVPEAASSWFLPRLVGISKAMEWCATGRVMLADEAQAGGLLRSVHAPDTLLDVARGIAREIADNTAPVSVSLTRQMLWRGLGFSHPMEAHRIDSRAVYGRGRSADASEGVTSFLEKRTPVYPDSVSQDMPGFYPWWEEPEWR